MASDGHGARNDALHLRTDGVSVLLGDGTTDAQVAVISVRHGDVYNHRALGEKLVYSLAQHEEERAGVSARTGGSGEVKKLNVLRVIHAIVHTLHLVVHLGADGRICHIEI